jgi:hypothetical protein
MRLGPATLIAMASATALACASIYDYRYRGSGESAPDVEALAGRVAAVLEPHGFVTLADGSARGEPERTRDLLSRELAAELSSGAVVLERRRRIALE